MLTMASKIDFTDNYPCLAALCGTTTQTRSPQALPDELVVMLFKMLAEGAQASPQAAARNIQALGQTCWGLHRISHDPSIREIIHCTRNEQTLVALARGYLPELGAAPSVEQIRAALQAANGLRTLNLSYCTAIPPELGRLPQLSTLDLFYPTLEFSSRNFSHLSGLPTLKIHLPAFPLSWTYIAPCTFSGMHQLTELRCENLRIKECGADTFYVLSQLKKLTLFCCAIDSSTGNLFDPLHHLEDLTLQYNDRIDLDTHCLPISLRRVAMDPQKNTPHPHYFTGLTNLETLELDPYANRPRFLTLGIEVQDTSAPTVLKRWHACKNYKPNQSELTAWYKTMVTWCKDTATSKDTLQVETLQPPRCEEDCRLLYQLYGQTVSRRPQANENLQQWGEQQLRSLQSDARVDLVFQWEARELLQATMQTIRAKYEHLPLKMRHEVDATIYALSRKEAGLTPNDPICGQWSDPLWGEHHRFDDPCMFIDAVVHVCDTMRAERALWPERLWQAVDAKIYELSRAKAGFSPNAPVGGEWLDPEWGKKNRYTDMILFMDAVLFVEEFRHTS